MHLRTNTYTYISMQAYVYLCDTVYGDVSGVADDSSARARRLFHLEYQAVYTYLRVLT
jgi:hypothetical protein